MKILVLPDSFKGTLSSIKVGNIIKNELGKKSFDVLALPFADGGEGTLSCYEYLFPNAKKKYLQVHTPNLKAKRKSYYLINKNTAIIESALAIPMDKDNYPNQLINSSFALGEMILDAKKHGIKDFIITLGGVCTTDYGIGMLKALGMSFSIENNDCFPYVNKLSLYNFDYKNMSEMMKDCKFKILCDVDNELFNEDGAALYYSRQKGASLKEAKLIENEAKKFVSKLDFKPDIYKRTASAGGLGFAFKNFLNAELVSGANEILSLYSKYIFNKLENIDYVITGEGKSDSSSFAGKTISILLSYFKNKSKVILLSGYISKKDMKKFIDFGFYDAISTQKKGNKDIMTLRKEASPSLRQAIRELKL